MLVTKRAVAVEGPDSAAPREAATAPSCPVCGGGHVEPRFTAPTAGAEGGVDPGAFRPSADRYGSTVGRVVRCVACGHGFVAELPASEAIDDAYADAVDEVSLREERWQVAGAARALVAVEELVEPGLVCDLGCWTGSFLVAAEDRGWRAVGVEPSRWASARARERGVDVRTATLDDHGVAEGACRLVVLADVLEHLADPASAVDVARRLLEPGGVLLVTVPDAGALLARALGRRWWSVLPMHLQYFTRASMVRLLTGGGLAVTSVRTHPKVFSARYYAERVEGYAPAVGRLSVRALERAGLAGRAVAPDFRDRMLVLARRPGADADPFVRHAEDVTQALPGGAPRDIKGTYIAFGRYLEERFDGAEPPQLSLPETAQAVAAAVPAAARLVLDAGCGPNPVASLAVASRGREVVALDIGIGMVRLARQVAAARGHRIAGVVGDVEALPFRSAAFDAVVSDDTIEHLPDDRAGARELARVTAPGGTVVVATPNRRSLDVLRRRLLDRLRRRRLPPQAYFAAASHLREYTATDLRQVLEPSLRVERFVAPRSRGRFRQVRALAPMVIAVTTRGRS